MEENKIELRNLKGKDLYPMARIITKIGFKEFKDCFQGDKIQTMLSASEGQVDDNLVSSIGATIIFDIAGIIIGNLDKCEEDINIFLSSLTGLKPMEIADLSLEDYFDLIVSLVKNPQFVSFFKRASKLVN